MSARISAEEMENRVMPMRLHGAQLEAGLVLVHNFSTLTTTSESEWSVELKCSPITFLIWSRTSWRGGAGVGLGATGYEYSISDVWANIIHVCSSPGWLCTNRF